MCCVQSVGILLLVMYVTVVCHGASINNGKYTRSREELSTNDIDATPENFYSGFRRTTPVRSEGHADPTIIKKGQYVPGNDGAYVHVPDKRERGKYIHVPNPYNGGYGPYSGVNIPYEYDPNGEYSSDRYQTTRTEVETTTSAWPRRTYDDEGKWKIIRQDEMKQPKKYQYLYETENGIYAQEQAVIGKNQTKTGGTQGQGFYQYIGDDDRIYRVEYTVGSQGYHPKLYIMPNPLSNRTTKAPKYVTPSRTKMPMWTEIKRTQKPLLTFARTRPTTPKPSTIQIYRYTTPRFFDKNIKNIVNQTPVTYPDVTTKRVESRVEVPIEDTIDTSYIKPVDERPVVTTNFELLLEKSTENDLTQMNLNPTEDSLINETSVTWDKSANPSQYTITPEYHEPIENTDTDANTTDFHDPSSSEQSPPVGVYEIIPSSSNEPETIPTEAAHIDLRLGDA